MKRKSAQVAVVMGDIVDSEDLRVGGSLNRKFNLVVEATNKAYRSSLLSPLTITLGDEFQGLARTLKVGFEMIEQFRANLFDGGVGCRFVLGLARLDTKINTVRAWNMMGDGLAPSREKLDDKSDRSGYRFSLYDDQPLELLLNSAGLSLTMIEEAWTPTQRKYVRLRKTGKSAAEIAKRLKVTPRSVHKVLEAARLRYYDTHRNAILSVLSQLDEKHLML